MAENKSFLQFIEEPSASGLTKVVTVISAPQSGLILGYIKWFGAWRKYCFYPNDNAIFDVGCLGEIVEQINILMEERKKHD